MSITAETAPRSRLKALADASRRASGFAWAPSARPSWCCSSLASRCSSPRRPHHYHLSKTEVFGIGTGILALTLGMRHAFDADHISAIDNTTRKLMAEGKRPLSVGFFFSLGHSTVVFVLAVAAELRHPGARRPGEERPSRACTAMTASSGRRCLGRLPLPDRRAQRRHPGVDRAGVPGHAPRSLRRRGARGQLNKRGLMNRFFGRLARRIDAPWKMYPIGVLFGLGFDTATEVALLVLSGTAVASGLPVLRRAVPADPLRGRDEPASTRIDGCFMNFAYGWAFSRPIRKVYYNIIITGLSVAVAFVDRDDRARSACFRPSSTSRAASGPTWPTSTSTQPASSSSGCSPSPGRSRSSSGASATSRTGGTPPQWKLEPLS